ncbi:hypothetical protein JG688_00009300 [Phytophthora aleatoria]|uniref:GPI-anchor transamidase n=1 Tax=Phytophthora aleatoria TaxID=2496075 RepID=A0A8J5ITV6_9STRA|nr:hypothetical protein JG688_00009300 [Phytophthora aleatoria]
MTRRTLFLWVPLLLVLSCVCGEEYHRHTNNWAVIVDTSRFWSNYRHVANALSLYHSVKRLGIPDSQIILMLADQMPCNARNCFPGQVFNSRTQKINLYGKNVEVDYRGSEVSVANFITVLTGRHEPGTPASKKLDTDENSNIFLYMSGHGGDGFLKFQDFEEMSSQDLADSIQEMHVKKRCVQLGLSVIDRFTFSTLDYLQRMKVGDSIRNGTLRDLFNFYDPRMLLSTPDYRTDILGRSIDEVPITDFLGSMLDVHLHFGDEVYPIEPTPIETTAAMEMEDSVGMLDSQRSGTSTLANVHSFGFTSEFFFGVAAAVIGAVFVTTRAI